MLKMKRVIRMRLHNQLILTDGEVVYAPSEETQLCPSRFNPLNETHKVSTEWQKRKIEKIIVAPIYGGALYLKRISVDNVKAHLYLIEGKTWGINVKHHRFVAPVTHYCNVPGHPTPPPPVFYRQKRNGDRYWIAPVRVV